MKVTQMSSSSDDVLYTNSDLLGSMSRIECVGLHEQVSVNGIRFTAFNAGHVLGAVMFQIELFGVRVCFSLVNCLQ